MLLDTSVLVELLRRPATDPLVKRILELAGDQPFFASPIHIGELADAARKGGLPPREVVGKALQMVELLPLDADTAILASDLKAEARRRRNGKAFSLIDGVGLATARTRGLPMLTMDTEFGGFEGVTVLEH